MPHASGAAVVEQTQLQQSIFNAPLPGSAPSKPPAAVDQVMKDAGTPESRGQKRGREEEEDEGEDSEGDVAMEEDSDDE
jgi:hypothetical protein